MIGGGDGKPMLEGLKVIDLSSLEAFASFMLKEHLGGKTFNPHLRALGFFERSEHPSEDALYQTREPSRLSGWQPGPLGHVPLLGENNAEFKKP